MVKMSRGYSADGFISGDGDSRTAHRRVGWQRRVEDDDFLDGNEDDNQQEIHGRGWLGSSSPLQCCSVLRRMGGGPPLTGTNNGGSVALEDEDVEADGDGCGD
jgi:hypothetical protein